MVIAGCITHGGDGFTFGSNQCCKYQLIFIYSAVVPIYLSKLNYMPGNGVCEPSRNTCWNVVKSEFTHDKARSLPTRTTCGGDTPGLFVHQTQLFVRWRCRALASYRVRRVPDIAGAAADCVCIHCLSVQWLLHVRAVAGSHRTEASVMSRITWPEGKILRQNPRSQLFS